MNLGVELLQLGIVAKAGFEEVRVLVAAEVEFEQFLFEGFAFVI